ncbi:hypothetical protein CLM62_45470 [Streptomyces sp. SA15]|uniref:tetratricopeptide repeat protein n=1 Tax=Streptomyces sp. SA15 TaxID=934019 RepID=UPI000BAFEFF7|nr:tetratricopeptide repeat protein [Streptomyces sp. SA15]PAZ09721.1 hypothetical protein CLM62_45470 [Streptomyces sp. SA15]
MSSFPNDPQAATGTFLAVVYQAYDDPRFQPLDGAVGQIDDLAGALGPFGFRPTVLADLGQRALSDELTDWAGAWKTDGGHGPAVAAWSGHGEITRQGELRLVTRATRDLRDAEQYFTAERLAGRALSAGADQILILLDTCYAGAGAPAALEEALNAMAERTLPEPRRAWLGILAACQAHEPAEGARGLLLETVLRVLRHGPARGSARLEGGYRHEWSVRNQGISGETLALAVMEDWPDSGQIPVRASAGRPERIFRNPLWRPNAGEALVEHLVLAAKGIDPTEEGWFFTGRNRILREITDWLAEGKAGLLLLTGSAGSGKSAVAGRIAALSHAEERRALFVHAPLGDDDPDPGEGSVEAALHLRGMHVQDLAEALAEQLGLPAPETPAGLIAELEGLEARGARRHVLVLDGLDEAAPDQAGPIADRLLVPLSRLCTVLLASRDRPFQPHREPGETLNAALTRTIGATVRVLDLDEEEDTTEDIAAYVRRRLVADDIPEGTADDIAPVVAERAVGSKGGFLFARIVASALARHLASDPTRSWREQIPEGITDALDRDLAAGAVRHRDGHRVPHAADDLLTALAWAAGNGMPAHGVWETVAKAVSRDGTAYGPEDIDWVLAHYGRYIVEDSDGQQAVYRLYHRELVAHLQSFGARDLPEGRTPAPWAVIDALVALVLRQTGGGRQPEEANGYLRRHLADHALPAANVGIAVLRKLVAVNSAAYVPVLASALHALSVYCRLAGLPLDSVELADEAVRIHRELAHDNPSAHRPDLAASLNNLAAQLGEAGRRDEALEAAREAVRIRRELAHDNPSAHRPDLAISLNTLSSRASDVGRLDEALEPVQEATSLYRELARDNPAAHTPYLAATLNNLARQLSEAGRREEAVHIVEEATSLYRELAMTSSAAHLPDLAASLNNLAAQRAEVGQREEAVAPAQEAAFLYREFARTSPAAYQPKLAMALSNLSNRLRAVGRRQEAVAPAQEAVRIRRQLAHDNPATHTPGLAYSLNNLALRLAAVGRREEAVDLAEEAVRIRRELAHDNPAAHLSSLAVSLNNLALRLGEVGRRQEAVDLAEEAVGIRRELARDNPAAHTPGLADTLDTLALRLAAVGRREEAVDLAEEAVRLRRDLTRKNPAAHTPGLADSLNTLALRLGDVGRWGDAMELAQEAASLYHDLARKNRAAHLPDLAMALTNLARGLGNVGRPEEAMEPAQEAVRLRRELAHDNPAAYRPKLALALNNLASQLSAVGRLEEAIEPAEEAVRIYRELAHAGPDAFLPGLAMALNNLGVHLAAVERREEAVEPAEEAVRIRRDLTRANPAAHAPDLADSLVHLARRLVESGQEEQARRRYEETIDAFRAQPPVAARLSYDFAVFLLGREAHGAAVHLLCSLVACPEPDDAPIVVRSHQLLRQATRSHPDQRATVVRLCGDGDHAPEWLEVTDAALELTHAWLAAPTWEDSRVFLHAHPGLLDGEAVPALREWALLDTTADLHTELLEHIAGGTPIDTAYRPLILQDCLKRWFRSSAEGTDWAGSAACLTAHATDLLTPDAALVLADATASGPGMDLLVQVHRAILALATRDGIEAAYRLVMDRRAFLGGVRDAVSAADGEVLGWLAVIEEGVFGAPWASAVHRLTAQALSDGSEGFDGSDGSDGSDGQAASAPAAVLATAAQQREPSAEERNLAVSEIAALLAVRPDRAAALSPVLSAALATPPAG